MAWIPLSVQDILNSLTEQEQTGTATDSAQSDLTVIVSSVTNLVRGKVNSIKRNQGHLGPEGTIPDELYAAAVSIARFKYLTHLPGTQLITVDRRTDKDEAYSQLEAVRDGSLVVMRFDEEESAIVSGDTDSAGPNLQGPGNDLSVLYGSSYASPGWPWWDGYW